VPLGSVCRGGGFNNFFQQQLFSGPVGRRRTYSRSDFDFFGLACCSHSGFDLSSCSARRLARQPEAKSAAAEADRELQPIAHAVDLVSTVKAVE